MGCWYGQAIPIQLQHDVEDGTVEPEDETYILGDIEAFLAALEGGSMQAQWDKDRAQCEAWIGGLLPRTTTCDASEG